MINKYLLLIFCCFFSCFSYATESALDTLKIPDTPINNRVLSSDFIEKYNTELYNYQVEEPSFLIRIKEWILSTIMEWLDISIENAEDIYYKLKIGLYLLIIVGVIYFITRIILKKEGRWFFRKKTTSDEILYSNLEENISGVNFKTLIEEANDHKDYRLAIRYYYLSLLKELNEASIIEYDPQKTNADYQVELSTSDYSENFLKASYYYSYIWYGEFEIDKEKYETALLVYNHLFKQINNA